MLEYKKQTLEIHNYVWILLAEKKIDTKNIKINKKNITIKKTKFIIWIINQ